MIRLFLFLPLLSLHAIPPFLVPAVQAAPVACSSAADASPVEVITAKVFCTWGNYIKKLDNLGRSIINLLSSDSEAPATEARTLPPEPDDDAQEESPSPTAEPTEASLEAFLPLTTHMLNFP